jgi:hypothetical protein
VLNYYLVVVVVDLESFLQSLVQFLSPFLQSFLSPPQQLMVHLLSLQLPLQVQSLPLQPLPASTGCAANAVIPAIANVKRIRFIIGVLKIIYSNIVRKMKQKRWG